MLRLVPIVALAAAGCAPQSATLTEGHYMAWLSDTNGLSLLKGSVEPDKYEKNWEIDCRDLKGDDEALRLPEPLEICRESSFKDNEAGETWASQSAFKVVYESAMDPWRGEAIITSENDLQIGFHQRTPDGEDFRFAFAIDPTFEPSRCVQTADGSGTVREPIDGSWIDNWSLDLETVAAMDADQQAYYEPILEFAPDGTLYYLTARGYQINPFDTGSQTDGADFWSLPEEWRAGFSTGKFSEEFFNHRPARYGDPLVYNAVDLDPETTETFNIENLWYCDVGVQDDPLDPADAFCDGETFAEMGDRVDETAALIGEEFDVLLADTAGGEPLFKYAPLTHHNEWRMCDGRAAGFDCWHEMHYSYVVFSADSNLEVGGSARGAMVLVLDSEDSQSRFLIQAKFEVPKIKRDKWRTKNLREEKREENNTPDCGAAPAAG